MTPDALIIPHARPMTFTGRFLNFVYVATASWLPKERRSRQMIALAAFARTTPKEDRKNRCLSVKQKAERSPAKRGKDEPQKNRSPRLRPSPPQAHDSNT